MDQMYITGLTEGQGCFCISFTLRTRLKLGIETRSFFSISLHKRDLDLIKLVRKYFNCGSVRYSNSDRCYKYETRSIRDIYKYIIPHFDKYPLMGSKKSDFEKFKIIVMKMKSNLHHNSDHLKQIIQIAYTMNPYGTRKHQMHTLLRALDNNKV